MNEVKQSTVAAVATAAPSALGGAELREAADQLARGASAPEITDRLASRTTKPSSSHTGTNVLTGALAFLVALICFRALGRGGRRRLAKAIGAASAGWSLATLVETWRPAVQDGVLETREASNGAGASSNGEQWWLQRICAPPTAVSTSVVAVGSDSEFLAQLLADEQPTRFVLPRIPGPRQNIDPGQIVLMAVYPSDVVRTIPSDAIVIGDEIEFIVEDRSAFLDPKAPPPVLSGGAVELRMTLFAVDCGGMQA